MFESLKKNLEQEKNIIVNMQSIQNTMQNDPANKKFYDANLQGLLRQLAILNNAIPDLLKEGGLSAKSISPNPVSSINKDQTKNTVVKKKLPVYANKISKNKTQPTPSTSIHKSALKDRKYVTINKDDKKEFLKKLKLSDGAMSKINRDDKKKSKVVIVKPSSFARISNKLFRKYSDKLSPQFLNLEKDLKKANIRFLLSTYLSMAIASVAIAFISGLLIFGVLLAFSFSNWIYFALPIGFSGVAIAMFYLYPSSEANSVQKKISQELPFATIYMSAIAGSNIEPTKIFKIIASSEEYPNIGKEIRKIIAQVHIYGYDLVTSLKNVAVRTSNKRLSELFSGLATNIASGGELKNYLEKKAENFLMDYRLERQQYSEMAGTFMDVYISILIAAPLVLMMMFIVMNVAGLGMGGLSITALLSLSIVGIAVVNIFFIVVLNMKQPKV